MKMNKRTSKLGWILLTVAGLELASYSHKLPTALAGVVTLPGGGQCEGSVSASGSLNGKVVCRYSNGDRYEAMAKKQVRGLIHLPTAVVIRDNFETAKSRDGEFGFMLAAIATRVYLKMESPTVRESISQLMATALKESFGKESLTVRVLLPLAMAIAVRELSAKVALTVRVLVPMLTAIATGAG